MDTMFLIALKSSFILGLIHGVNPCGHSWIVLAPFTVGNKNPLKVTLYTTSFILGTAVACLLIGATLGMLSTKIPAGVTQMLEYGISAFIIVIGVLLIVDPHLLHSHSCENDKRVDKGVLGLFAIGFVNMIIPCPTLAIMYSYAIESANVYTSTAVFASYALATGISIAGVIFSIYKVTSLMQKLQKHWIEHAVMRTAGVLTVLFGVLSFFME